MSVQAIRVVVAALVLAFAASGAHGGVFHVSPKGSDQAPGGELTPFRTIAHGLPRLKPGDTLRLAPGEYAETCEIACLRGAPDAPITIQGGPGVVLRPPGRDAFLVWKGSEWIIFEDLEITGGSRAGILVSSSKHILIRRCVMRGNRVWQVQTTLSEHVTVEDCDLSGSQKEHGIYFSTTDYPIARRNRIHHNAGCGVHMNGDLNEGGDGMVTGARIEANIIHDCGAAGGAGINMDGVEKSLIVNNLLYDNRAGGITNFHCNGARVGSGNRILHNTVVFRPGAGRFALQLAGGSDLVIRNNIFLCDKTAIEADPSALAGLASNGNLFFSRGKAAPILLGNAITLAAWQQRTQQDLQSLCAEPRFRDAAAGDFRLTSDSPGAASVAPVEDAETDLAGIKRPAAAPWTVGAYALP